MTKRRVFRRLLLAALACVLPAAQGAAQPPPFVVAVSFEIDVPRLEQFWAPAEMKAVSSALGDHLVDALEARFPMWHEDFPLWTFAYGVAAPRVLLAFRVVEPPRRNVFDLELQTYVDRVPSRTEIFPLTIAWYEPGDLGRRGLPMPRMTLDEIAALADALLDENQPTLNDWLQDHVPVAVGAQWRDPDITDSPFLVLPLRWDQYDRLRASEFRLRCQVPEEGELRLDSNAVGLSGPFRGPSGATEYDGLVVKLTNPERSAPLTANVLRASHVYMARFLPAGWFIALAEDAQ